MDFDHALTINEKCLSRNEPRNTSYEDRPRWQNLIRMTQRPTNIFMRLWRAIPSIDLYGEAVQTDPSRFRRTYEGACVSVVCIGVTITLIVLDIIRLSTSAVGGEVSGIKDFPISSDPSRYASRRLILFLQDGSGTIVSIPSEKLKLNGFFLDSDTNKLLHADDGRWDFPTLTIEATSSLEFYNAGQRTLHKIEIVDNSGINQVLTSDQRSTPIAKGLFQKLKAQPPPLTTLPGAPPERHNPPTQAEANAPRTDG